MIRLFVPRDAAAVACGAEAVVAAVDRFEQNAEAITPHACRDNVERFSEAAFDAALLKAFATVVAMRDGRVRPLR